jgi:hypothetical protein
LFENYFFDVTGGIDYNGMSITVVTPPAAAAEEPCSKSSLNSNPEYRSEHVNQLHRE